MYLIARLAQSYRDSIEPAGSLVLVSVPVRDFFFSKFSDGL